MTGLDPTSVVGWIVWVLLFLIWEGRGIYYRVKAGKDVGTTLSEVVWAVFATRNSGPTTWWVKGRRFALVVFLAWLVLHFLGGGRFWG